MKISTLEFIYDKNKNKIQSPRWYAGKENKMLIHRRAVYLYVYRFFSYVQCTCTLVEGYFFIRTPKDMRTEGSSHKERWPNRQIDSLPPKFAASCNYREELPISSLFLPLSFSSRCTRIVLFISNLITHPYFVELN